MRDLEHVDRDVHVTTDEGGAAVVQHGQSSEAPAKRDPRLTHTRTLATLTDVRDRLCAIQRERASDDLALGEQLTDAIDRLDDEIAAEVRALDASEGAGTPP